MLGFSFGWFIGQWGPKISCTKTQTLPNLRLPISSAHQSLKTDIQSCRCLGLPPTWFGQPNFIILWLGQKRYCVFIVNHESLSTYLNRVDVYHDQVMSKCASHTFLSIAVNNQKSERHIDSEIYSAYQHTHETMCAKPKKRYTTWIRYRKFWSTR